MDLNLKNKVALIVGASQGIGFGIAKELVLEGAKLSIGSRSESKINKASESLKSINPTATVISSKLDISNPASIHSWIESSVKTLGGIDLLVVNSGGPIPGTFETLDEKNWEEAFELLLLGAIRTIRGALPYLKQSSAPSILCVTSTAVKQPIPNLLLSGVFRSGVSSLMKSLSVEFAKYNIRVNNLLPGRIDTERVKELDTLSASNKGHSAEKEKELISQMIPLGRYGEVEEIAKTAAFLLSPAASYISGQMIVVDGGMLKTL